MPEQAFMMAFCRMCRNHECVRAQHGNPWTARMGNQVEYLLEHPIFSDMTSADHQRIAEQMFEDRLQHALAVEVARINQDWEPLSYIAPPPEESPEEAPEPPPEEEEPKAEEEVDPIPEDPQIEEDLEGSLVELGKDLISPEGWAALKQHARDGTGPFLPKEPEEEGPESPPTPPPHLPINTPMPSGGVMLDGTAPLPPSKKEEDDPWTPKAKETIVLPGAKIKI